jgi:hypothetical protein
MIFERLVQGSRKQGSLIPHKVRCRVPAAIAHLRGDVTGSSDKGFEPVRQLHEFELARVFRAIKGITHDDLAQFGEGVDVTELRQIVLGVTCRTGTQRFEQAFALGGSDPLCTVDTASPPTALPSATLPQPGSYRPPVPRVCNLSLISVSLQAEITTVFASGWHRLLPLRCMAVSLPVLEASSCTSQLEQIYYTFLSFFSVCWPNSPVTSTDFFEQMNCLVALRLV